jgi:uncharacterized membrane protein YfcA
VVARFWPAFLAIIIGILIGVKILVSIDERSLLLIVGTAVIVFTLLQGSSYRLEIPPSMVRPAGAVFGLGSGLIGGISSFFGPMLIIYLVSIPRLGKDEFVGSISFLYIGAVLPWTATLIYHGVLDGQLLLYSTLAAIPVSLGMLLGQKLRTFIADHHFNRLILGILLCSGGAILWRAFA